MGKEEQEDCDAMAGTYDADENACSYETPKANVTKFYKKRVVPEKTGE